MSLFSKNIKNNRGIILLLTLFILSGILIVTLTAADLVLVGIKMNRLTGYSSLAFFASEAGMEKALWEARKNNYVLPDSDQNNIFPSANTLNNNSSYQVDYATSSPDITFRSIGRYLGVQRSVEGTYEIGNGGGSPGCTPDCTGAVCGDSDGCEDICDGSCVTGSCVAGVCIDSCSASTVCGTSCVFGGLTYGTVTGADGRCWLDRNLGATQVAVSSTDSASYGWYYQWGRLTDGHQIPTSATSPNLSSTDDPSDPLDTGGIDNDGKFITVNFPLDSDWRKPPNNNLWQGLSGINNPCPTGFRVPTEGEWYQISNQFSPSNSAGAWSSSLKLPLAGSRNSGNGSVGYQGIGGYYQSDSASLPSHLYLNSTYLGMYSTFHATGCSVRCIKN